MTVQRSKIMLNAARFPLISTKGTRTVFVSGTDSAPRTPRQFIGAEQSTDYNLPQVLYMENVMPVSEGLRSVGYVQSIPADPTETSFDSIFPLRDANENLVLYSPGRGKNYVYVDGVGWQTRSHATIFGETLNALAESLETARVTYAYVDGKTLVCYAHQYSTTDTDMSVMIWNTSTLQLNSATALLVNLPFAFGEIDGIASSNGYLIVWSGLSVAWAAFNGTAFDFSPYENGEFTGAGNQIPEDVQGPILAITSVSGGFLMFTSRNCVGASYNSQNTVSPWIFREIANSGGVATYESITVEGSLSAVFAYTTAGLQKITLNGAETIHPQVSDFLAGQKIEHYDAATQTLTQVDFDQDLAHKITNVGNRYIVISYGQSTGAYQYALIWDLAFERFGKMKFAHTDCFYYTYTPPVPGLTYDDLGVLTYDEMMTTLYGDLSSYSSVQLTGAQHALGFLTTTGEISVALWADSYRGGTDAGVAILGRMQLTRSRNTEISRVEIEGMSGGAAYITPSYDGRTLVASIPMTPVISAPTGTVFGTAVACLNCNLIVQGSFDLSTIIVESMPTGQV